MGQFECLKPPERVETPDSWRLFQLKNSRVQHWVSDAEAATEQG